jgi:hypothetical protein
MIQGLSGRALRKKALVKSQQLFLNGTAVPVVARTMKAAGLLELGTL